METKSQTTQKEIDELKNELNDIKRQNFEASEKLRDLGVGQDETDEARTSTEQKKAEDIEKKKEEILDTIKAGEEIKNLESEEKEKTNWGLWNVGFKVEQMKNKFWANAFGAVAEKMNREGTAGKVFEELKNSFVRDAQEAEKKATGEDGFKKGAFSTLKLVGNITKYGRMIADVTGASIANPFRYVMMGGMVTSRLAEAGKEVRLQSEDVLEKTRVLDINDAWEEAYAVYERAKEKEQKAGNKGVSAEALKHAYMMEMPKDLQKRLENPSTANYGIQLILKGDLKMGIARLNKQIEKIEKDEDLSLEQKEQEIEKLVLKQKKKLEGYDRMVTQYGTVDEIAMSLRYAQKLGKGVVLGMQIETAVVSLDKLWGSLSHLLSSDSTPHIDSSFQKPTIPEKVIIGELKPDVKEEVIGAKIDESFQNTAQDNTRVEQIIQQGKGSASLAKTHINILDTKENLTTPEETVPEELKEEAIEEKTITKPKLEIKIPKEQELPIQTEPEALNKPITLNETIDQKTPQATGVVLENKNTVPLQTNPDATTTNPDIATLNLVDIPKTDPAQIIKLTDSNSNGMTNGSIENTGYSMGAISPLKGEYNTYGTQESQELYNDENSWATKVPMTDRAVFDQRIKIPTSNLGSNTNGTNLENIHTKSMSELETAKVLDGLKDKSDVLDTFGSDNIIDIEKPDTATIQNMRHENWNNYSDNLFKTEGLKFKSYAQYEKEVQLQKLFGTGEEGIAQDPITHKSSQAASMTYFRDQPIWPTMEKIPAKYLFNFDEEMTANPSEVSQEKLQSLMKAGILNESHEFVNKQALSKLKEVYTKFVEYDTANSNPNINQDTFKKLVELNSKPYYNETIEEYVERITEKVHQTNDGTLFVIKPEAFSDNKIHILNKENVYIKGAGYDDRYNTRTINIPRGNIAPRIESYRTDGVPNIHPRYGDFNSGPNLRKRKLLGGALRILGAIIDHDSKWGSGDFNSWTHKPRGY